MISKPQSDAITFPPMREMMEHSVLEGVVFLKPSKLFQKIIIRIRQKTRCNVVPLPSTIDMLGRLGLGSEMMQAN